MKKLLLSITAVLTLGMANAQIYSAADTTDFQAWSTFDADNDGNDWFTIDLTGSGLPMESQGGVFASQSWSQVPLTPDNYAVTPVINCSALTSIGLSWTAGSPDPTSSTFYEEHYAVYVINNPTILATGPLPTPVWEGTLTAGEVMQPQSVNISAIAAGQATVYVVFRHYNCTDEDIFFLDDVKVSNTAGLSETEMTVAVYPNPTNSTLNIKTSNAANHVSIISMDGKVVAESNLNGLTGSINVAELVNGVYFYEVRSSNGAVIRNTFVKN